MRTEALICPDVNKALAIRTRAQALRYDDLSRVLVDVGKCMPPSKKGTRDRKPGSEQDDLWAHLAVLRAENDRLTEIVADQLEDFAARVAKLEAQIRRPWWRRIFERAVPNERPRNRASERLRRLYFGST